MPVGVFEKQIAFLRRHREIVSLDHLYVCLLDGQGLEPRQVVLTFDDGYKNNLHVVAPLLKAWNLPFTIFINTRNVSECRRLPGYYIRTALLYTEKPQVYLRTLRKGFDTTTREKRLAAARVIVEATKRAPLGLVDQVATECLEQVSSAKWAELNAQFKSEEPMSWDDVVSVTSMGATIGSHCHDHCILHSNQSREEVHRQINESKAAIEKNVAECKYMAYPNGTVDDISSVAYSAAKRAQFQMAFSTIEGEITADFDCLLAPRIFAVPEYEEFCYRLNRTGRHNAGYRVARLQYVESGNYQPRSRIEDVR